MFLCIFLIFQTLTTQLICLSAVCRQRTVSCNCVLHFGKSFSVILGVQMVTLVTIWLLTPMQRGTNLEEFCRVWSQFRFPKPFQWGDVFSLPLMLVGPVLRHLKNHRRSCTVVVLDFYPRKYWRPLVQCYSVESLKLARKGDSKALLVPSKKGWVPHYRIPEDLVAVAFGVKFWFAEYITI